VTGEHLIQRADDAEETVRKRLDVYHKQTKQLVEYYSQLAANRGTSGPKYRKISGTGPVDAIRDRLLSALSS